MSLLAAAIAKGSGSLISGGLKLIGSAKQLQAQKQISRGLRKANNQYREDLIALSESLSDRPQLEIDDSAVKEQVSRARRSQITAGGRSIGEEAMRDSVRQSTADAVARGRSTGGSTADLLSFAAAATTDERSAMSQIDAESASRRERSLFAAEDRLNQALSREQEFNRWRDNAIYQDELAAFNQQLAMDEKIAGAGYDMTMSELTQKGALADTKAAMWGAIGDTVEGVGTGVGDLFMAQDNINTTAAGAKPSSSQPSVTQSRYNVSRDRSKQRLSRSQRD